MNDHLSGDRSFGPHAHGHHLHIRRGLLLLAGMVACLTLGVYLERFYLGRYTLFHGAAAQDTYQFFDPVVDAYAQIRANYVEPVENQKLIQGSIDGMLSQLDPYSNYFTKEELQAFDKQAHGQFSGIGCEIDQDRATGQYFIVSPIEDSPALKAGMLAGDKILKLNGDPTDGMSMSDLIKKVAGPANTELIMTVVHEGEKNPVDLHITRAVITVHSIKGFKLINGDGKWDFLISPEHRIAYVRITSFMDSTAEDLDKALLPLINSEQGLRGIILDLRFNPGGLLNAGVDVADRFLESGTIVTTKGRDGKNQDLREAHKEGTYPRIPLVVVVNEYSASASEIVAGALKDHHRAVLIGNRTFGKGSVQTLISLDGGNSALKLTTAYYYLPSGRNIAKRKDAKTWGVDPDPQFLIPCTDAENHALLTARRNSEIIRPVIATTAPASAPATQPTTKPDQAADRQLQRAVEVLIANQILTGQSPVSDAVTTRPSVTASVPPTAPASAPTSAPASAPTTAPATTPTTKPATSPDGARSPEDPVDLPHL